MEIQVYENVKAQLDVKCNEVIELKRKKQKQQDKIFELNLRILILVGYKLSLTHLWKMSLFDW